MHCTRQNNKLRVTFGWRDDTTPMNNYYNVCFPLFDLYSWLSNYVEPARGWSALIAPGVGLVDWVTSGTRTDGSSPCLVDMNDDLCEWPARFALFEINSTQKPDFTWQQFLCDDSEGESEVRVFTAHLLETKTNSTPIHGHTHTRIQRQTRWPLKIMHINPKSFYHRYIYRGDW